MAQNRADAERRRAREISAGIAAASIREMLNMLSGAPAILKQELEARAREMDKLNNGRRINTDEIFAMGATWNPIAGDDQEVPQ